MFLLVKHLALCSCFFCLENNQELKELKSRRKKSSSEPGGSAQNPESPTTRCVQLSITEFYRSSKGGCLAKAEESVAENSKHSVGSCKEKRKESSPKLSKSVRRRLLFS